MMELGFKLSSEEHRPEALVEQAQRAEEGGFTFAMISDHFHPWTDKQGQSPFVWTMLGAIAQATKRLRLGTGVTCPTVRIHPTIIAQAAATTAALMPGRFLLGIGSGEALNEHILGHRWPPAPTRIAMMEEAVTLIRLLWQGGMQDHRGDFYTVENAQIYTLPEELPPILLAAEGPHAARTAGKLGDGLITTSPNAEAVKTFREAGGEGKPCYAEMTVCWAKSEAEARRTAHEWWPIAAMQGELLQILPVPAHFEQAAKLVREEDVAKAVVCGPDVQRYVEKLREYMDAGIDHIWIHQIGPDQEGFFRFWEQELQAAARAVVGRQR